jgi:hypothetical protein
MTDITLRLYEWYSYMSEGDDKRALVGDALDEIRKLRAKIEAISQVAGKASIDGMTFAQIKQGFGDNPALGKFMGETNGE